MATVSQTLLGCALGGARALIADYDDATLALQSLRITGASGRACAWRWRAGAATLASEAAAANEEKSRDLTLLGLLMQAAGRLPAGAAIEAEWTP